MDRTKEAFELFNEKNKDLEQNDYLNLLKETFGNAPYEFIDEEQIPKKSVFRKKPLTLSPKYKAKNPQPNYYNFGKKPEYIDTMKRHYKLATGLVKQRLVDEGEITNPYFSQPDMYKPRSYGKQAFWIRIPISLRGKVNYPDVNSSEEIELYHVDTMTKCTAVVEACFHGGRKKTGYVVLKDFSSHGSDRDHNKFEEIME
jgi:hypothetical protein